MNNNLWYALIKDTTDNDWGTGTFDKTEAIEKLKSSNGYYTIIAVIDGNECIEEITLADLD